MLWTESSAVLSLFYHYFHSLAYFPSDKAGAYAPVAVPGLPTMAAGDLPVLIHAPEQFVWRQALVADLRSLRETVSWLLVNTFRRAGGGGDAREGWEMEGRGERGAGHRAGNSVLSLGAGSY